MKKLFLALVAALFILPSFAQMKYDGETNKKGEPHGMGTMLFTERNFIYKIDGQFKKGIPVSGTDSCFLRRDGSLGYAREGDFFLKQKGVFSSSRDLYFKGKYVSYEYEDNRDFRDHGFTVKISDMYDSRSDKNSYQVVGTKKKEMLVVVSGVSKGWTDKLTPEAEKYYNQLFPAYFYYLCKDKGDLDYYSLKDCSGSLIFPSEDYYSMDEYRIVKWSGALKGGIPEGTGTGIAVNNGKYLFLRGSFDEGKPSGEPFIYKFRESVTNKLVTSDVKIYPLENGFYQILGKDCIILNPGLHLKHDLLTAKLIDRRTLFERGWELKAIDERPSGFMLSFVESKFSQTVKYMIDKSGNYIGPAPEMKDIYRENVKSILPDLDTLLLVFNTTDIIEPGKNFKEKYKVDYDRMVRREREIKYFWKSNDVMKELAEEQKAALSAEDRNKLGWIDELERLYGDINNADVYSKGLISLAESQKPHWSAVSVDGMVKSMIGDIEGHRRVNQLRNDRLKAMIADPAFPVRSKEMSDLVFEYLDFIDDYYEEYYWEAYRIASAKAKGIAYNRYQTVKSFLFGGGSSSSSGSGSSVSSSGMSSESERIEQSNGPEQYSCEVEIVFKDGSKLTVTDVDAEIHRGRFVDEGGYVKAWADGDGKCVITWDKNRGDYIKRLSFVKNIVYTEGYVLPDLRLEPGKSYVLNADNLKEK